MLAKGSDVMSPGCPFIKLETFRYLRISLKTSCDHKNLVLNLLWFCKLEFRKWGQMEGWWGLLNSSFLTWACKLEERSSQALDRSEASITVW